MISEDESNYQRIITALNNWEWEAYEENMKLLLSYIQAAPSTIVTFASLVMETYPKGGTFFNTTLSFLPMDDWPKVVPQAMVMLPSRSN